MLSSSNSNILSRAYEYCESVTKYHARSFYFAAKFLPPEKRRAVYPIYAFCRHVDDAVDEADESAERTPREVVGIWEERLRDVFRGDVKTASEPTEQDLVFIAWQDLLGKHRFAENLPLDLIKGVVQDTEINRYETFDELYVYCYRVASTVGLMSSEILGYSDPVALDHAEALGIAMQLTNILRDVKEDAARNRIYLPQEDLRRFGVSEEQLFDNRVESNFVEMMKFQIARAREYYRKGDAGIRFLERDSRLTVGLASTIYSRILDEIEKQDHDVFRRRAHTSAAQKLLTIPRVWFDLRRGS
ncbi:MAG: squalene/phytoene synthase family protein [Acidobacteria bacterium]|nr:squalene/phytoene synthase family protein [Acidobacteriota bacterium]